MHTFVLNDESAGFPIDGLVKQAGNGGVEAHDVRGKVVAYILTPDDKEASTYADANLELDQHRSEIEQAVKPTGGITTQELLAKTASAVRSADIE